MFKKSKPSQGDLFKSISNQVSDRKRRLLEDPSGWHNVYYEQVTRHIDESIFSVLYDNKTGRPNASIRVLVGMMILKEGNGWSDEQLFEECRFNLRVMRALGLQNLDEDVPTESTWYDFRRSLGQYSMTHEADLMKECFQGITSDQLTLHGVSGRKVRMDSKLINSNIAAFSRVEMILEVVRVFMSPLPLEPLQGVLRSEDLELLKELKQKSVSNITYPLSSARQKKLLHSLGDLIRQLLSFYRDAGVEKYELLERVWSEQYTMEQTDEDDQPPTPTPLAPQKISSSSLQSPHDPQATFRSKGNGKTKKMVSGYHANITETCEEDNPVNLIIDVDVQAANTCESEFLIPTLKASEEVLKKAAKKNTSCQATAQTIEHATTDGGYDSIQNRIAMSRPGAPRWNLSKPKGKPSHFFFFFDEHGQLQARDKRTDQLCQVSFSEPAQKFVIQPVNYPIRYFTNEQIQNALLRQHIEAQKRPEDRSIRANVEATIHQVFHRLHKREKVKYRGQHASQCYVLCRALWANFRRISRKVLAESPFSDFSGLRNAWKTLILTWSLCQRTFLRYSLLSVSLK